MEYISVKEASARWGIDSSRVGRLARAGRIPGAVIIARNWMIPADAPKPADARTRMFRSRAPEPAFRFPLFINFSPESYNPPLTPEELSLRQAQLDFFSCRFEQAERTLSRLSELSESVYIRISATFFMCLLSFIYNADINWEYYYHRFITLFEKDFPHRTDMRMFIPWLYSFLMQYNAAADSFGVQADYEYSPDANSLISLLSFYGVATEDYARTGSRLLAIYEMTCRQMEESGYFYEAHELHFLLFIAYSMLMDDRARQYHLKKALSIACEHDMLYVACAYRCFYTDEIDQCLQDLPTGFADGVRQASESFARNYAVFTARHESSDLLSVFGDNHQYILYAIRGLTYKQTAELMHVSERTVAGKYSEIYARLGIKGKSDLIRLIMNPYRSGQLAAADESRDK